MIPIAVDLARFRPTATGTLLAERADVALFVGRLTYEKGLDVLLHA